MKILHAILLYLASLSTKSTVDMYFIIYGLGFSQSKVGTFRP